MVASHDPFIGYPSRITVTIYLYKRSDTSSLGLYIVSQKLGFRFYFNSKNGITTHELDTVQCMYRLHQHSLYILQEVLDVRL